MRLIAAASGFTQQTTHRMSKAWGLSLMCCTVLAGCSSKSTSQVKHDADAPVRDSGAWNWNSATDADYAQIMLPLLGMNPQTVLAKDSPITQRAQFWLDQVDALLRAKYPNQLVDVPKPQAKVLKVGVPNAFVAPVPTCYSVPVQTGPAGVLASDSKVFVDVKSGTLAVWPAELKCKDGDASRSGLAVVKAFVKKFNASSDSCKFSVNANGALVPSSACAGDAEVAAVGQSAGIVLMETANFVTVHSGIMTIMPEADFVSVLAHELGHYYRSHITAAKSDYDYYYTLTPNEPAHKPAPEADKADLGKAALVAAGLLSAGDTFPVVSSSQKLRSDLFLTVGSLVTQVAAMDGAPDSCADAGAALSSPDFNQALGMFPFVKTVTPALAASYRLYEKEALQCLGDLNFTAHGSLDASSIGFDAVRALAAAPTWPEFLTALTPAGQARLVQVNKIVSARLGVQAPPAATAAEALLAISAGFAAQDQQSVTALNLVHDQHIGQYTIEQEADDESAEWIAGLGIDPEAGVDSMRSLGKGMKASLAGNILAQADCDQLWQAGWTRADGSYSFIPLGNLTDPHHSVCYRMFNIEREIKAHHLKAAAVPVPTPSGPSWLELQALASSLIPTPNLDFSFATKSSVSPFVTATDAMSCTYASMYQP